MEVITKDSAVIPASPAETARAKRIDLYRYKLLYMKWRNESNAEFKRVHG
jgi:hypothetical protein